MGEGGAEGRPHLPECPAPCTAAGRPHRQRSASRAGCAICARRQCRSMPRARERRRVAPSDGGEAVADHVLVALRSVPAPPADRLVTAPRCRPAPRHIARVQCRIHAGVRCDVAARLVACSRRIRSTARLASRATYCGGQALRDLCASFPPQSSHPLLPPFALLPFPPTWHRWPVTSSRYLVTQAPLTWTSRCKPRPTRSRTPGCASPSCMALSKAPRRTPKMSRNIVLVFLRLLGSNLSAVQKQHASSGAACAPAAALPTADSASRASTEAATTSCDKPVARGRARG